jgi:PAS domain S-box-containing protein
MAALRFLCMSLSWLGGACLSLPTCLGALPAADGAAPAANPTPPRLVRVGLYQNPPKILRDEAGQPAGIFVDLLEQIAEEENWQLNFVDCPWSDCLKELQRGSLDLMPDVAWSLERAEVLDFHQTAVIQSWSRIYAPSSGDFNLLEDLRGARVAVVARSVHQEVFQTLAKGFGYRIEMVEVDSMAAAFELVASKEADAAIVNHLFGQAHCSQYGLQATSIEFNPSTLFFAVAKGRNADLLQGIDRQLDRWISRPGSAYYSTLGHWVPGQEKPLPRWLGGATLAGLVLLAGLVGLTLFLRRLVRMRTQRLLQTHEEWRRSQQRFQTLTAISPVGIFQTSADGATTFVNPRWCEIAGVSQEAALGHGWLQAIHPDDRQILEKGWQEAFHLAKISQTTYRFLHPDGRTVWVQGQAVPELDEHGEILGYVGTITDISLRVLAEEQLKKLNLELEHRVAERTGELEEALVQAREADRLKSAFLATMSHELRTPLNSIIGFTGVMLQGLAGPLNREQEKQLNMVRKSASHLLALINDVLDLSKIESGQLEVSPTAFDVGDAVRSVLRTVADQAEKKGLTLEAILPPAPPVLVSDQRRVEQILLNLLSNAIKFTLRGGVKMTVNSQEGELFFAVQDTGIGIAEQNLARIFHPFFQIDTGLNRRHDGTGLGLAISRYLAHLLGGSLTVTSRVAEGTTFVLQLPLEISGGSHGPRPNH